MCMCVRVMQAASAGAACHSSGSPGARSISRVLQEIGTPVEFGIGTLRLSCSPFTSLEEIDIAASLVLGEAARQGVMVSAWKWEDYMKLDAM